jgi:hypothetical protein
MPPRYLRKASPDRLKHCQERTFEACDNEPTDQCCGVIPCKLCLEWETYEGGIEYGSAEFGTASWTGTVGGGSFVAYWERDVYSNECEFVVNFDGEEVYRSDCYGGASCRNPAGEVAALIGYEEGTLRWSVYQPRELALIDDPETGCRDFFCGTCRCTCDCLCVTITETDGNIIQGELCTASYPCDAPVWEGTLGYYDLSIALGRDEYTADCIITLIANGEEPEPVFVTGCADMSASVTLYDGTIISVACKQCACVEPANTCCGASASSYLGCAFVSAVANSCVNELRIWSDDWTANIDHGLPATSIDWATITSQFYNAYTNYIKSIPGCEDFESDTAVRIFQLFDVTPEAAALYGVQDCDWGIEVYYRSLVGGTGPWIRTGVYFEYAKLCGCGTNDSSNVLRWLVFYDVPLGDGLGSMQVTLTRPSEGLCGEPLNTDC